MSQIVVADKYLAPKINGKYAKEHKILQRKGMVIDRNYAERYNAEETNGIMFVIDDEATAKRNQQKNGIIKDDKQKAKVVLVDVEDKGSSKETINDSDLKLSELREKYAHLGIKASSTKSFLEQLEKTKTGRKTAPPTDE